jgi:hypothetical protein
MRQLAAGDVVATGCGIAPKTQRDRQYGKSREPNPFELLEHTFLRSLGNRRSEGEEGKIWNQTCKFNHIALPASMPLTGPCSIHASEMGAPGLFARYYVSVGIHPAKA